MRLPDMYCFLCGQRFSLSQSGISETSSRERTRTLSVRAIVQILKTSFCWRRRYVGECRVSSAECRVERQKSLPLDTCPSTLYLFPARLCPNTPNSNLKQHLPGSA